LGSDGIHDAKDFCEEFAAFVERTISLSSVAKRLARETRMDAIHSADVFGWVEQPNVSFVHLQAGEPSFCGSFPQDSAAIFVPLNSDNWLVSEDEVGKQSASGPGKEVHGSEHFTYDSVLHPVRNTLSLHRRCRTRPAPSVRQCGARCT